MNDADFLSATGVLLAVNSGLLGISATLLALVPALLGAFDNSRTTFVQNEVGRLKVEDGLRLMRATIILFAIGSLLGIISLLYRLFAMFDKTTSSTTQSVSHQVIQTFKSDVPIYMILLSGAVASIGLLLITVAAFRLAQISRFILRGKNC